MTKISSEITQFLDKQRLGFIASINPDNTPNLSPKGTIFAWDDEHLVFADIRSPQTVSNLQKNPNVEINVIDPLLRKGYRFKGTAKLLQDKDLSRALAFFANKGIQSAIHAVMQIRIQNITEVTSPLYDLGFTEEQIKEKWKKHYLSS